MTGVDPSCGRAHGLAGVTGFLLALAEQAGDQRTLAAAAADHAGRLAERTRQLLPEAAASSAPSIAFSWCQGLAGIGQVLLSASAVLDDPSLADLARNAADMCIARVPTLSTLGRCCGAAGVGHFLLDLAHAGQDERYWHAALDIGRQMLLRSSGPPGHPVFTQDKADRSGVAWAFGIAGLLPFFDRLARRGIPDNLPLE